MGNAATPAITDMAAQGAQIDANFTVSDRIAWAFAPHEQSTPNMTVRLEAGGLFNGSTVTERAAQNTSTITAPSSNPRIDRVVVDRASGDVSVVTGTEAGSPSAPAIPDGKVPVAQVLLQTSSSVITNSMITDERVLNALGLGSIAFQNANDVSITGGELGGVTVIAENTTTARPIDERFGQWITPRDFGAIGDGVADDTAALLACFKDGRGVALESGMIYKITDALDLLGYSSRTILGPSAAANPSSPSGFQNSKPAVIRQATANKQIFRLSGSHHVIGGFYLDYATQQTTSNTSSLAIELNNVSHSTFRNLRIFYAYISIGIPQSAYSPTSYNALFDCIFDGIDSNQASGSHADLRNYNGGGTTSSIRNLYINGGGSLDFTTPGQSAAYAMRFSNWSGLDISGVSIDGLQIGTIGIEFHNCAYVIDMFRFEACKVTSDAALWISHIGGFCNGFAPNVELRNCRWSPNVATSMYVLQSSTPVVKLLIEKVNIGSDCDFGSSGTRRVFSNNGGLESGTGYFNDVRVREIDDQGAKLSDLVWSDTIAAPGPYFVREWNCAGVNTLLRNGRSTSTCRIIGGTASPTGGTWGVGDMCFNTTPGDVGRPLVWQCITAGTPGTWVPIRNGEGGATTWGDVDTTLTPQTSRRVNTWITTLTADRTVTLSTTGVWSGCSFRVVRSAAGAFNLNVGSGPLKVLAPGTWCEVTYDTSWRLTGYGSLGTLAVADGGTGASSLTSNAVLLGNGTSTIGTVSGLGTSGQVLTSNGSGNPPSWQALALAGGLSGIAVFTSSGTWTKPAGVTKLLVVAIGGGGGAGMASGSSDGEGGQIAGASGGGGGGACTIKLVDVSALETSATVSVTVGAAGVAGSSGGGGNGGNGGDSFFGSSPEYCRAGGGVGSIAAGSDNGAGGAGGSSGSGDIIIQGADGDDGFAISNGGWQGGSGGSAGGWGGGGGRPTAAGNNYGGGGGGNAKTGSGGGVSGGAGAPGAVIVLQF